MKRNLYVSRAVTVVAVLGLWAGCQMLGSPRGMIAVENIDGLARDIVERHDAYVTTDRALAPEKRSIYLTSSKLLMQVLEEAKTGKAPPPPPSTPPSTPLVPVKSP